MVATPAVNRAAHRIDHEAIGHRLLLYSRMEPEHRIEWLLRAAVGDELDRLEQTATAYVADMMMIAEALVQASRQMLPHLLYLPEKVVAADDLLHGQPGRGRHRMAHIGMAVLEEARAVR